METQSDGVGRVRLQQMRQCGRFNGMETSKYPELEIVQKQLHMWADRIDAPTPKHHFDSVVM